MHGPQAVPAGAVLQASGAALPNHDDIGLGAHDEFGVEFGKCAQGSGNDVFDTQTGQRLADEGAFPRRIGALVDLKIHPRIAQRGCQGLRSGSDSGIDLTPEAGGVLNLQQLPQRQNYPLHVGMGFGLQGHDLDAQALQQLPHAGGFGHQHHIGFEGDDGFHTRV